MASEHALRVDSLRIEVAASGADIVDRVTFSIAPGEVLGLVGESGSGKTTVALAVLAHHRRGVRIKGGTIHVGDRNVLALSAADRRDARGRIVSYVPQDPAVSLNPARRVGAQLLEALRVHDYGDGDAARRARIAETMREVLLPDDDAFQRRYPHELSGGQQQRVAIAMAFACKPAVVVLDEPTTGLDVTTQAHILETIRRMTRSEGAAALYVTHDLAVVANLADRVAVMYAGLVVEQGPDERALRACRAPVHAPPAGGDSTHRGRARSARHSRSRARAGAAAARLPVRATLRAGDRRVLGRSSRPSWQSASGTRRAACAWPRRWRASPPTA